MSTPLNGGQMKSKIDQDITSKQGIKKSINPNFLGTHLKVMVDYIEKRITDALNAVTSLGNSLTSLITNVSNRVTILEEAELPVSGDEGNVLEARENGLYVPTPEGGGGGGSAAVMRYPKDETITEAQIGRLAMMKKISGEKGSFTFYNPIGIYPDNITGEFTAGDTLTDGDELVAEFIELIFDGDGDSYTVIVNVISGVLINGSTLTNGSGGIFANILMYPQSIGVGNFLVLADPTTEPEPTYFIQGVITSIEENTLEFEAINSIATPSGTVFMFVFGEENEEPHGLFVLDMDSLVMPEMGYKASLAQTEPEIEGTKAEFDLVFTNDTNVTEPTTRVVRITFYGDNIQDGQILTISGNDYNSDPFSVDLVFSDTPASDEVEIGATLADTLDNLEAFLLAEEYPYFSVVARDGSNSIDLELLTDWKDDAVALFTDGLPFAAYRVEAELSGNLGDAGGGGLATYSEVQALANPTFALNYTQWVVLNANSNIFLYGDHYSSGTVGYLRWLQIYGNGSGAMGLSYFTDTEDFADAIVNALENDSITFFDDIFEIVEAPLVNTEAGTVSVIVRRKVSFILNTNFQFSNDVDFIDNGVDISTTVYPTLNAPKMVRNTILGSIVGVDGDEVLVDKSITFKAKLAGDDEGVSTQALIAPYKIPYILTGGYMGPNVLLAWDNGTVISYYALAVMGITGSRLTTIAMFATTINGQFSILDTPNENGEVQVLRSSIIISL